MFENLNTATRLLLTQNLEPVLTRRFQPTGFADLGAAVYRTPDGVRMLLVESAQSVANRLEVVCLDRGVGPGLAPELDGLPYVLVRLTGDADAVTSSLIEAHRINSPFIISNDAFQKPFLDLSGYSRGKPLDWQKAARAIFHYDPNALLHGVFMANLEDGRLRFPRALTGFIEARNVEEAASGGVKNSPVDPTGKLRAENLDENVYGNVPYLRTEYTAESIQACFNIDLALIASYGLPPEASDLLIALSLYKIRRFLRTGLRLRTACDFAERGSLEVQTPTGFQVPSEETLIARIRECIAACASNGLFASPAITQLETKCVRKADKEAKSAGAAG